MIRLAVACLALLIASPSLAEDTPKRGHSMALSFSPIHAIAPILEVQAEFYLGEGFSIAPIVGFGQITAEISDGFSTSEETFSVFEAGGQLRAYFFGSSEEGAFAGPEILYVSVDGDVDGTTAVGNGLQLGGVVGYKWTWDNFFIDLNGGAGYVAVKAESSDGDEAEDSDVLPIINFNLGWAF